MMIPKRPRPRQPATIRKLASLLFALPLAAQACYAPPQAQMMDVNEQLRQASEVALAQVISATPLNETEVEYRFIVLEQLAGPARKVLTVVGGAAPAPGKEATFGGHADFGFWARGGGRVMNGPDCAIRPDFAVGASYLVFLGSPSTRRSFERIAISGNTADPDDKWLAYVKAQLAKREGGAAAARDATPDYERAGRFIYGFHRIVRRDELERKTLAAQHAPTGLLLRAGALADEFDHIVQRSANVPDAEIEATLREAVAVQAVLAAWRDGGARPASASAP